MKFLKWISTALMLITLSSVSGTAMASDTFLEWMISFNHMDGVRPVDNKAYKTECSSCHIAYQPGLLPARSWEKLLTPAGLHNHFGEVADLDKETLQDILAYALANSAEKSYFKRARSITASTKDSDAPLRITEVRYISRKHHDIPDIMIKGNKNVLSLSRCDACHTQAEKGDYDADTVRIPNYPDY
jgi:hypothetical protein